MRVFAVLGYGTALQAAPAGRADAGAEEAARCFHVRAESAGETVPLVRESGLADDLAELIPYPSSILDVADGPPGIVWYGPAPKGFARPK